MQRRGQSGPHRADGCGGGVQQLAVGRLVCHLVEQVHQVNIGRQRSAAGRGAEQGGDTARQSGNACGAARRPRQLWVCAVAGTLTGKQGGLGRACAGRSTTGNTVPVERCRFEVPSTCRNASAAWPGPGRPRLPHGPPKVLLEDAVDAGLQDDAVIDGHHSHLAAGREARNSVGETVRPRCPGTVAWVCWPPPPSGPMQAAAGPSKRANRHETRGRCVPWLCRPGAARGGGALPRPCTLGPTATPWAVGTSRVGRAA